MSTLEVNTIKPISGSSTITLGGSGDTINLGSGASGLATTNGITEADQWRLTASFTGDVSPISSNLSRVNTDGFNYIGTGMTESSGIFTFPSTGIYLVKAVARFFLNNASGSTTHTSIFNECKIETTTDNSTYNVASNMSNQFLGGAYVNAEQNCYGDFIFDVTNTSTHKVRFSIDVQNVAVTTHGNTGQNLTYFTFIRLGDT